MFLKKDQTKLTQQTDSKSKNFTLNDVKELTWTRVLEISALEKKAISAEDTSECTQAAAKQVGEAATPKEFLLARHTFIIDKIKKRIPALLHPSPVNLRIWSVGIIFVIIAFVLGILTDELSTSGNKINLLAPPLLGLFLWNLIIYLWLFISYIFKLLRKGKSSPKQPIRELVGALLLKVQTYASKKSPNLTAFYKLWVPAESNYLGRAVASILHLSALFFGLGLIFSIAIRGWGTAYTAGWESTWLAESPDTVLAFLQFVYSLAPVNDGLFQTLNVDMVKNMRFDINPTGVPATYWMVRLITATILIVIIPRLILFTYNQIRLSLITNNFPINLQTPYYQNIIRQWHGQSMTIRVLPFGKSLNAEEKNALEDLALRINQSGSKFIYEETAHEDSPLPVIEGGRAEELWIVFQMSSTPEMEVHINFANSVKDLCNKNGATCRVIVNTDSFIERFANTPKRIEEREKNWRSFLITTGLPFAFANLTALNTQNVLDEFEKTANHN